MNVLDLFSGIGGFSLGLERAGMRTVAFCEIDQYARAVLRKHWPAIPIYEDISTLARRIHMNEPEDAEGYVECQIHPGRDFGECPCIGTDQLLDETGGIDVICGGFPCQDISYAGKGAGVAGARSGLWSEFARIISEIRPQYAIVENVAALLGRGIGQVLGDLAEIGYDAEWHCISASAAGACHKRDRVWIVAYPASVRMERLWPEGVGFSQSLDFPFLPLRDSDGQWKVEPDIRRTVHGVPNRMDRLKCLGNAVVPQIPEIIGRAIMNCHAM